MNIALIVPGGVDRSGHERVIPALLWLIERLARNHPVLVIATNQYPSPCRYSLLGAEIINLGSIPFHIPGINRINHLWKIVKVLKSNFNADILHGFWASRTGFLAVSAGKLLNKPVVISLAGGELVWFPEIGYGRQRSFMDRFAVSWTLKGAHRVTAGSRFVMDLLKDIDIQPDWIPLGVDTNLLNGNYEKKMGPPWILIHVGSINRIKNQKMLLESFKLVLDNGFDTYLDWVGEDTLDGELQNLVARFGLQDRVRFYGYLPLEEIVPLYQRAHLFLQSSSYEAQGVAVCEAAAMGVPTIGTNVGIVSELSPDSAIAIPVNDVNALAREIIRLLGDSQSRYKIAHNAKTWAHTYNADWTASSLLGIYAELLRDARVDYNHS